MAKAKSLTEEKIEMEPGMSLVLSAREDFVKVPYELPSGSLEVRESPNGVLLFAIFVIYC